MPNLQKLGKLLRGMVSSSFSHNLVSERLTAQGILGVCVCLVQQGGASEARTCSWEGTADEFPTLTLTDCRF